MPWPRTLAAALAAVLVAGCRMERAAAPAPVVLEPEGANAATALVAADAQHLGYELTLPGELSFPVPAGSGQVVSFACTPTAGARVRLRVGLAGRAGGAPELYEETIEPPAPGSGWTPVRIRVPDGTAARLRLHAEPIGTALLVARLLCSAPVLGGEAGPVAGPSVLFVIVDALRPDHLSTYGYARPTSPAVDGLAQDGIVFTQAVASGPMTVPSMPQILRSRVLPGPEAPLTEAVVAARPLNAALVTNPYLYVWLCLGAGRPFSLIDGRPADAEQLTDRTLAWLDRQPRGPFFLYVHYLDTHTPYHVPEPAAGRFVDAAYRGEIGLTFGDVEGARQPGRYGAEDRRRIVDLYDGAIAYADGAIGRLLAGLRERGLYDGTLVVLAADHGEELWEHGGFFHGQSLYEELLRIPLVVKFPGSAPRGERIGALVGSVDIVPTILETLGLPVPPGLAGRSLRAAAAEGGERRILATALAREYPVRMAIRTPQQKYIRSEDGTEELYDRATDPGERTNRAGSAPEVVARFRDELAARTGELATWGVQLRLRGGAGTGYRVTVDLRDEDHALALPWPTSLGAGGRLETVERGRSLAWSGTLDGAESGIRFDVKKIHVLGQPCRLALDVVFDGVRPLPARVRLGPAGRAAASLPLEIALDTDVDVGGPAAPRDDAGPELVLWRAAEASAADRPASAVAAPDVSERLRALGYAE